MKRPGFKNRGNGLARSAFVRKKADAEKKRVETKRRARVRRAKLKKVGDNSKSKLWPRAWRKFKPKFERAGIDRCEECGSKYFLTPAHTLKRRHITNELELNEVAILCQPCHEKYELMGEEKMCKAIRAIIAGRPNRLTEAA